MSFLFGSGPSDVQHIAPITPSFNAGGLSGSVSSGGNATVTPTTDRSNIVGGLANTYGDLGNQFGTLRSTVTPGYNDLLASRLSTFNDTATKAIGDLSQSLRTRRVLGSSFGQDTIARTQALQSQQRDAIVADNFQKSLDLNQQLLAKQYEANVNQYQTGLNELNLEANTATQLGQQGASILNQAAQFNSSIDQFNAKQQAADQAGKGQFLGSLIKTGASLALAPVTGGASLALLGTNLGSAGGTGGGLGGLY
jgi:hypothetical protein